ncbi:hypothetical protein [Polyangium jinanense]|uniref:Uncharacterized protein n=1 Tax=Polyangium jinanense TaxID=2829994 RepID=A0A9X4AW44_9BACT|nr:hypothetical protein [Polyangium jinanense]MDC3960630.1 hypothetical protein [Polyangium jinanense]MDC3986918.1 hypothetical protein [Polyangium jinanense]
MPDSSGPQERGTEGRSENVLPLPGAYGLGQLGAWNDVEHFVGGLQFGAVNHVTGAANLSKQDGLPFLPVMHVGL